MVRLLTILTLVVLLSGCAGGHTMFVKSDYEPKQFAYDKEQCALTTGVNNNGSFAFGPIAFVAVVTAIEATTQHQKNKQFIRCMELKGYALDKPPPAQSQNDGTTKRPLE